jgi:hypothetical protein
VETESILGVYAQLAVLIVGLSGVIGVTGHRAAGDWQIADYSRFWTMMASGFALLFQAIFPIILLYFSLASHIVWVWSSVAAALIVCGQLYWRRWALYKSAHLDPRFSVFLWWFNTTLQIAVIVILILNAVGLGFKGAFAPYLLAMSLVLAQSCMNFVRLLIVALPRAPTH